MINIAYVWVNGILDKHLFKSESINLYPDLILKEELSIVERNVVMLYGTSDTDVFQHLYVVKGHYTKNIETIFTIDSDIMHMLQPEIKVSIVNGLDILSIYDRWIAIQYIRNSTYKLFNTNLANILENNKIYDFMDIGSYDLIREMLNSVYPNSNWAYSAEYHAFCSTITNKFGDEFTLSLYLDIVYRKHALLHNLKRNI